MTPDSINEQAMNDQAQESPGNVQAQNILYAYFYITIYSFPYLLLPIPCVENEGQEQ